MFRASLPLFLFFSLLIPALFYSSPVAAQLQGRYDAYEMSFSEETPSPGEDVEITLRSNKSLTSNIRSVHWFVNGRERREFTNKINMAEVVGSSPKQIVARIIYFDVFGQRKQVQLTRWIRTAVFDLLWEGDSVVTPRYRGYKLAGPQTPIKISAKIQYIDQGGTTYTEKDFSFRWEIESRFYGDIGPGESTVTYEEGGTLMNNFVFVKARAALINNPEIMFEKYVSIPIVAPRILLYPHTLLYGLLADSAVPSDAVIRRQPLTVSAYPFYFSKDDFDKNGIQYRWFVNKSANHLKEGRKIDISIEGERASIPIQIRAQNENRKQQNTDSFFTFSL